MGRWRWKRPEKCRPNLPHDRNALPENLSVWYRQVEKATPTPFVTSIRIGGSQQLKTNAVSSSVCSISRKRLEKTG